MADRFCIVCDTPISDKRSHAECCSASCRRTFQTESRQAGAPIVRRQKAIARNLALLRQAAPDALIRVRLTSPGTHKTFYKSGRLRERPAPNAETIVLHIASGETREFDLAEVTLSFADERERMDRLQFDNV